MCVCVCDNGIIEEKFLSFAFHRDLVLFPVESNNVMTSQLGVFLREEIKCRNYQQIFFASKFF